MKLHVISDTHIGVLRSAGTTPTTQWALRQGLTTQFDALISKIDTDLMILGDLFDTGSVPMWDWLQTFTSLSGWLVKHPANVLYLVAGNHDLNKTSNVLSSFQLLGSVLSSAFNNVKVILQPTMTPHGYVIPHLPNQDLFGVALSQVPECSTLFLHCNFDNGFAAESDQSLNLSPEQAEALPVKHIVIAHEHQTRKVGKIWIPGNQLVSSVSDCLGTDAKRYVTVTDGQPELHKLQEVDTLLARMDWTQLEPTDCPFIRIQGDAGSDQAAAVVSAIARYRNSSNALVITNAVKIAGDTVGESFASNLESVKAFDVMATLKEILTAEEFAVVESVQ